MNDLRYVFLAAHRFVVIKTRPNRTFLDMQGIRTIGRRPHPTRALIQYFYLVRVLVILQLIWWRKFVFLTGIVINLENFA